MRRISPANNVMKINHEGKSIIVLTMLPEFDIMDLNNEGIIPKNTHNERKNEF